jgi:hypothetical protein
MKWHAVLCHCHEWSSVGGDIGQKGHHIVNQAYKPLNVIVITGCKCGGCDRRPHADMSNSMLYSVLSRYMSDP